MTPPLVQPAVRLHDTSLVLGGRTIWKHLSLDIAPGEFLAVLGPNGAGKTSFLRVLLGVYPVSSGSVEISGKSPKREAGQIGYIPQQKAFDPDLPVRGRDLVHFGLDGHRYWARIHSHQTDAIIDEAIRRVGAGKIALAPIGLLSGGEQQRLRIAQAILGDPKLLLCDEPLLSLDLTHQKAISRLIDEQRRRTNAAVVFVTHELNPILPYVDRVLYIVNGRWAIGRPEEILTSKKLSELYGSAVDVIRVRGRIIIVVAERGDETHLAIPQGEAQ